MSTTNSSEENNINFEYAIDYIVRIHLKIYLKTKLLDYIIVIYSRYIKD